MKRAKKLPGAGVRTVWRPLVLVALVVIAFASGTRAETMVARGSQWKYLDDGSDQGTAWRTLAYDDSAWASGAAQLGYGDNDEATRIGFGPSTSEKYLTTYFRRTFEVNDPTLLQDVLVRLLRDDGAVVYLNGVEVIRDNMPEGEITHLTRADDGIGGSSEDKYYDTILPATHLVAGTNILAVEIHQSKPGSSDLSFDLELIAFAGAAPPPPPEPEPAPEAPPPPPPPAEDYLVQSGAPWRYLDDGSDQGSAWTANAFDDAAWSAGAAQFGYGDGDEATIVDYGDDSKNKHMTTYFRHAFEVADPAAFEGLTIRLLRDDGAIVYLNGTEVWRDNMPAGPIAYDARADGGAYGDNERSFHEHTIRADLLQAGTNVIAVEVHQAKESSSDMSFDLELLRAQIQEEVPEERTVDPDPIPDVPAEEGVVPLTVRDASGYGATDHPVTVVVPLPYGAFQTTETFRITDASGGAVPAQFEVLNRWWARDNSIRHVMAHFEATVAPNGNTSFGFRTDGGAEATPAHGIAITETPGRITVDTGTLRFALDTAAFNLFDEVALDRDGDGAYSLAERIVAPGASDGAVFTGRLAGDVQRARDRTDLDITVEEAGPMRAVVRIESLGEFQSTSNHTHGFCVRIYAYAGKSFVKVDYQLQNSAKNVARSWPLYFEEVALHLKPTLTDPTLRLSPLFGETWEGAPGASLYQSSMTDVAVHDDAGDTVLQSHAIAPASSSFAWADLADDRHGVAVAIRHFAEMWPNGIAVGTGHDIAVQLWPARGTMWADRQLNPTGLYWLEDLQHVLKQTLFYFHGPDASANELTALAANFGYHPVVHVHYDHYRRTRATFDLDGLVPSESDEDGRDGNRVGYDDKEIDITSGRYAFGWMNFGGYTGRKTASKAGSYPKSAGNWYQSGFTKRWFEWERRAYGDLNCRPMWIAGYTHDADFLVVQPTVDPSGGKSWRVFDGHGTDYLAAPYLEGTFFNEWYPRDNAHGWFYHIEEYYTYSGDYWVKDWYRFIGEFRKRSLLRTLPRGESSDGPQDLKEFNFSTRAEGHMLSNAWQAYRVTGDPQLLDGLKNRIRWLRDNKQLRQWGNIKDEGNEAAFQVGYVARAVLNNLWELEGHHAADEALAYVFLWGLMDWHYEFSQYSYYLAAHEGDPMRESSGTSLTMVDPSILWYLRSGQAKHRDLAVQYVDHGLRSGKKPYGHWSDYEGGWEGRAYWAESLAPATLAPAPAAVADLTATRAAGAVDIAWTAPAAQRYLVFWSTTPLSPTFTSDPALMNVWYANVVPAAIESAAGSAQTLSFPVTAGAGETIHVALVAFADGGGMSPVSNVASTAAE